MENIKTPRTGRHCVSMMHCHLVFITKYREGLFTAEHLESLHSIFAKVCEDFEAELVTFNGEKDHVHLLVNYPPKVSISALVNSLKGASSRRIKRLYPELNQPAYRGNALWSPSYFAGSVGGASIEAVQEYIRARKTPD
ncbi:MAG TPA: IS200/IS605 family transposase [Pseudomonas sp.]